MHPRCIITVNGTPVAGVFWEKLIRVTVNDKEGVRSDSIELELEDGPPHLAIPDEGDIIRCWLGYTAGAFDFMGAYTVDDVDVAFLPWTLKIRGKSADMREKLKEHKNRHWDKKTLGDVYGDLARDAGLPLQIDPEIGTFKYEWLGQENESAIHLGERLADRHDALFTVKDGKMIVAKRGSGATPGGGSMGTLVITPPMILKGTGSVSFGQREKHKEVRAEYHDQETGKRAHVDEPSDPKGTARYTMRHAFAGKDEAKRAARSRAKYLKRSGVRTTVGIEGNPLAKAGLTMVYAGVRPGIDGLPFIIEDASHTFAKGQGYRTELKGKSKD